MVSRILNKTCNYNDFAKRIIWKVSKINLNIASVRLRAFIPAIELAKRGYPVCIGDNNIDKEVIESSDLIIINKSFTDLDVQLAIEAKRLGKKLIFDLCDNIFVDNYRGGDTKILENYRLISELADCIVVPTKELAKIVQKNSSEKYVVIIEDANQNSSIKKVYSYIQTINHKYFNLVFGVDSIDVTLLLVFSNSIRNEWLSRIYLLLNKLNYCVHTAKNIFNYKILDRNKKTIVWFGNSSSSYGKWGVICLVDILSHLNGISRQVPIQLLVISSNTEVLSEIRDKAVFPVCYRKWNTIISNDLIAKSDVCVIPSSGDDFSITKSSNRAALALSLGVPVVADEIPSIKDFGKAVTLNQWQDGLRKYLINPALTRRHVELGKNIVKENFSASRICDKWERLLLEIAR